MTAFNDIKRACFIGIGGIGMSALARYFHSAGIEVAGYDRVSTPLTDRLTKEGMNIHFTEDISALPAPFLSSAETLVVYTPAVPANHREMKYFREHQFRIMKRSEALGLIVHDMDVIAVAGTHGKTTISGMLSHILYASGIEYGAFLGGISKNAGTNYVSPGRSGRVVVEADEYDRSFLSLHPKMAIVTATDADHLDIYGNRAEVVESYSRFVSQIREGGILLVKKGLEFTGSLPATVYTYSLDEEADFRATGISREGFRYHFSLETPEMVISDLVLGIYGKVNLENAVAASAMALLSGAGEEGIRKGLLTYAGIKRRFDIIIEEQGCVYIDDYAHHPEELKAFISSVREALPGKRLAGIFQPHLYTRTRDFAPAFAESLSALDDVILLDIYPAREEPVEGVGPEIILDKLSNPGKKLVCSKEDLPGVIKELDPPVLLTMGAGDIDQWVEPLKNLLTQMRG